MCRSRKYPHLPHNPPPPRTRLEIPIKLHTFLSFFGLTVTFLPQEIPIPSVVIVWIFSGTAYFPVGGKTGGEKESYCQTY